MLPSFVEIAMTGPIKIAVSACLLGEQVRYDGRCKQDKWITGVLGRIFSLVPVCPEVECGLPVPRPAMRLEGDPRTPRLVVIADGADLTERMNHWCCEKIAELERMGLSGFILKERSPSCGLWQVPVLAGGKQGWGSGLFAGALRARLPLLPVEEPERLTDPASRESFIERVSAYHRQQEPVAGVADRP
jgi:uncharacterized protein YbbK (DUF523 family)